VNNFEIIGYGLFFHKINLMIISNSLIVFVFFAMHKKASKLNAIDACLTDYFINKL